MSRGVEAINRDQITVSEISAQQLGNQNLEISSRACYFYHLTENFWVSASDGRHLNLDGSRTLINRLMSQTSSCSTIIEVQWYLICTH